MSLIKVNSIVHPSGTANNITLDNAGNVTLASDLNFTSTTLASPTSAGLMEYNGTALHFTPLGTQRGIVPGMQYFRLNSDLAGLNATGNQNIFGVGVTLSSNTVYAFEALVGMLKTAGATSHTHSMGFGGTATLNNIMYEVIVGPAAGSSFSNIDATYYVILRDATQVAIQGAVAQATVVRAWNIKGTVSVNSGGTFIPQYSLSAAPGGAYSTIAGSYMAIWPISVGGSNSSVGTWA